MFESPNRRRRYFPWRLSALRKFMRWIMARIYISYCLTDWTPTATERSEKSKFWGSSSYNFRPVVWSVVAWNTSPETQTCPFPHIVIPISIKALFSGTSSTTFTFVQSVTPVTFLPHILSNARVSLQIPSRSKILIINEAEPSVASILRNPENFIRLPRYLSAPKVWVNSAPK